MLAKSVLCCAVLALSSTAFADNLCESKEDVIVSFQLQKSNKTASLCRGQAFAYLVYRFGTKAKIELSYPPELNSKSWEKFEYINDTMHGGSRTAAVSSNDISFTNDGVEYTLLETWKTQDEASYIGILLNFGKVTREFRGKKSSQEGTLMNLSDEGTPLKNMLRTE
jgi:hypothetical protein